MSQNILIKKENKYYTKLPNGSIKELNKNTNLNIEGNDNSRKYYRKLEDGAKKQYTRIENLNSEESVCPICYKPIIYNNNSNSTVSINPCGHLFHKKCIEESFERIGNKCPICMEKYNNPRNLKNILGRNIGLCKNINLNSVLIYDSNHTMINSEFYKDSKTKYAIAWNPDSSLIATDCKDGNFKVWNLNSKKELLSINAHTSYINSIKWSYDGTKIATCSSGGKIKIWNSQTGKLINTIGKHTIFEKYPINSISWSYDDTRIAYTCSDKKIRIINVLEAPSRAWISPFLRSSDIKYPGCGATGLTEGCGSLRKTPTKKIIEIDSKNIQYHISWSPDDSYILTNDNYSLYIWYVLDGKIELIGKSDEKDNIIYSVWSNKSSFIAYISGDGTVKILDSLFKNNKLNNKYISIIDDSINNYRIHSFSWSLDDTKILTCGVNTIKLWNVFNGQCIINFHTNMSSLFNTISMKWSPDNKNIAIGYGYVNDDRILHTVKIWGISDLQEGGKKAGKLIDSYKKMDLIKIAKEYNVSLETKDKTLKTKLQLFNSLKRKKII
jgi:WD40 repeat protein